MTAPIRRVAGFVFGTWLGTGLVAVLLVLLLGGLAWIASTGRWADPQHLNIPVVHPWPPDGYYVNPFNPNDRGDLVSKSEANAVKADFLRAGALEIQALGENDAAALSQADTGNRHRVLLDLLNQQKAQRIVRRYTQPSIERLWVGRLADPNDASVSWCVQEAATQIEETVDLTSGAVLKRQNFRGDNRYWLVKGRDRWLITDALVRAQPVQ